MSAINIPQGVIDAILERVNHIHDSDTRNSLISCTLVARSFLAKSQSLLFKVVEFDITHASQLKRFQNLCKTILLGRYLGAYVRELHLRTDVPNILESHIPAFNAFRTLTNINAFSFTCGTGIEWDQLALSVRANLGYVLNSTSLRCVTLGSIRKLPLNFLVRFTQMEYLKLASDMNVDMNTTSTLFSKASVAALSNVKLQSLDLHDLSPEIVASLASMLSHDPNLLQELRVTPVSFWNTGFPSAVWNLIRTAGHSIQHFEWCSLSSTPLFFQPIDLSFLRNSLRYLTISVTYHLMFNDSVVLVDVLHLLEQLSTMDNVIEVVLVKCFFSGKYDAHDRPDHLVEWSEIDKVLKCTAFKKLRRVQLNLTPMLVNQPHPDWWYTTAAAFSNELVWTKRRGVEITFGRDASPEG